MIDSPKSPVTELEGAVLVAKDMALLRRTIRRAMRQTAIERWLEQMEREELSRSRL